MYHLIIVDDEIIIRNALAKSIAWNRLGVSVDASLSNGKEAADYMDSHPVDIIISDIKMPFMDGMELLRYANRHFPHIKVILLTGYAEFDYVKQALKYNVCDYMLKPVQNQELEDVVLKSIRDIEGNREVLQLMEHKAEECRRNSLRRCLAGTASWEEREQTLRHVGVYSLIVVIFDFNETQLRRQRQYFEFVENFTRSPCMETMLAEEGGYLGFTDIQPDKQCLLLYTQEGKAALDNLFVKRVAGLIYEYIVEKDRNVTVTVAYGGYGRDRSRIAQEYSAILNTLNMRHILGNNRVLESSTADVRKDDMDIISYPSGEILEHIRFGQVEEVERDINVVYDRFSRGNVGLSLNAARNLSVELAVTIFRLQPSEGEQVSFLFFLNELQEMKTVQELKNKILELGVTVAKGNVGKYQKSQTRLAEEALEYMRREYADSGLGLEKISDALHVSATYLSIVLKRVTGCNFSTHLLNVRMERAKELLQEDNQKLQEVAEAVGYSSSQYFSVCFKKYTGMTPSQFREAASKKA